MNIYLPRKRADLRIGLGLVDLGAAVSLGLFLSSLLTICAIIAGSI